MEFWTRYGNYEFLLMSFSLSKSLMKTIDLMNKVFRSYLDSFVIASNDDIWYIRKVRVNTWIT